MSAYVSRAEIMDIKNKALAEYERKKAAKAEEEVSAYQLAVRENAHNFHQLLAAGLPGAVTIEAVHSTYYRPVAWIFQHIGFDVEMDAPSLSHEIVIAKKRGYRIPTSSGVAKRWGGPLGKRMESKWRLPEPADHADYVTHGYTQQGSRDMVLADTGEVFHIRNTEEGYRGAITINAGDLWRPAPTVYAPGLLPTEFTHRLYELTKGTLEKEGLEYVDFDPFQA